MRRDDVRECRLVERYQHFGGTYRLNPHGNTCLALKLKTSVFSKYFYVSVNLHCVASHRNQSLCRLRFKFYPPLVLCFTQFYKRIGLFTSRSTVR